MSSRWPAYTLQEVEAPLPSVTPQATPFTMDKPNEQLHVLNRVMQPNAP